MIRDGFDLAAFARLRDDFVFSAVGLASRRRAFEVGFGLAVAVREGLALGLVREGLDFGLVREGSDFGLAREGSDFGLVRFALGLVRFAFDAFGLARLGLLALGLARVGVVALGCGSALRGALLAGARLARAG